MFQYSIPSEENLYSIELDLTHSDDFGYENIYVDFQTTFPDGKRANEITSLNLTDNLGSWVGRCGSENCKATFLLREDVSFSSKGDYVVRVTQHSREEKLPGISQVTLRLINVEKSK